jgi:hypothetical protein
LRILGQEHDLFSQVEFPQDFFIFLDVFTLEIIEEPAAPAYQQKQPAARMEIVLVIFEVFS